MKKLQVFNKEKELREMKADERRVLNDSLKHPKVTGHTYPEFMRMDNESKLQRSEMFRSLSDNYFG